jgi:hypothetical protein
MGWATAAVLAPLFVGTGGGARFSPESEPLGTLVTASGMGSEVVASFCELSLSPLALSGSVLDFLTPSRGSS